MTLLVIFSVSSFATNEVCKKADYVVFSFRKTECKGKCPVYFMEIYKSGKVSFTGTKNTDKIGKFTKQITKKELKKLIAAFEKAKFFDFKDEYSSQISDLPTTYISYTNKDKTKKIRDYHGAPKELKDLELLLESIVNSANWAKSE